MTNEQNDKVEDLTETTSAQRAAQLAADRAEFWDSVPDAFKVTRQQKRAVQRRAEKRNG